MTARHGVPQIIQRAIGVGGKLLACLTQGGLDRLGHFLFFDDHTVAVRLQKVFAPLGALGCLLDVVVGCLLVLVQLSEQHEVAFAPLDDAVDVLHLVGRFFRSLFHLGLDDFPGQLAIFERGANFDARVGLRIMSAQQSGLFIEPQGRHHFVLFQRDLRAQEQLIVKQPRVFESQRERRSARISAGCAWAFSHWLTMLARK